MTPDSDRATADELAIFIDENGNYRILLPNKWATAAGGKIPEFAFLAIAAILRIARPDEIEFAQAVAAWGNRELRQRDGTSYDFAPKPKTKPKKPRLN